MSDSTQTRPPGRTQTFVSGFTSVLSKVPFVGDKDKDKEKQEETSEPSPRRVGTISGAQIPVGARPNQMVKVNPLSPNNPAPVPSKEEPPAPRKGSFLSRSKSTNSIRNPAPVPQNPSPALVAMNSLPQIPSQGGKATLIKRPSTNSIDVVKHPGAPGADSNRPPLRPPPEVPKGSVIRGPLAPPPKPKRMNPQVPGTQQPTPASTQTSPIAPQPPLSPLPPVPTAPLPPIPEIPPRNEASNPSSPTTTPISSPPSSVPTSPRTSINESQSGESAEENSTEDSATTPRITTPRSTTETAEATEEEVVPPPLLSEEEEITLASLNVDLNRFKTSLSGMERQRQLVLDEILNTEDDYVRDLELTINHFLKPMRERKILDQRGISSLFSNIEVILNLNKQFLMEFKKRLRASLYSNMLHLGDIFKRFADYFKMSTVYCANQPETARMLEECKKNSAFVAFIKEAEKDECVRGLTLYSFLIKPVQRVCKYPLFIRDLLRQTPKESPDVAILSDALVKIDDIVNHINEGTRRIENQQKVLEIQKRIEKHEKLGSTLVTPSRRFVREGKFTVQTLDKKTAECYTFLFNDLIIAAKQEFGRKKLKLFACIAIHAQSKVMEINDFCNVITPADEGVVFPPSNKPPDCLLMKGATPEETAEWAAEIKNILKQETANKDMRAGVAAIKAKK